MKEEAPSWEVFLYLVDKASPCGREFPSELERCLLYDCLSIAKSWNPKDYNLQAHRKDTSPVLGYGAPAEAGMLQIQ